jgi:uncharacterized protein (TIGR02217 family)
MTITNGFVDDAKLDDAIEQGAEGGPGFLTTILQLSSGFEKRNIEWSRERGTWDISYGIQSPTEFQDVVNLFYVCFGRGYGFRFKDWMDFQIGDTTTNTSQSIATGDGTTLAFQIVKSYTASSGDFFLRKITRPTNENFAVRVFLNGIEQFSNFSVTYDTGVLSFTAGHAPGIGVIISVICEFHVPVRFDTDVLKVKATWTGAAELPAITILEIKE